jgi:hypothetical protein
MIGGVVEEENNVDKLIGIARALHKINFGGNGIIRPVTGDCDYEGGSDYDFGEWKSKGGKHCYDGKDPQDCYCNKCDLIVDKTFMPVSHGTHMYDFLMAHTLSDLARNVGKSFEEKLKDIAKWSQKPVLFVMENPAGGCYDNNVDNSKDKNVYKIFEDENTKNPTTSWYWLDGSYGEDETDDVFANSCRFIKKSEYGKLVYSLMKIFHIANGYMTNMAKCGIGKDVTAEKFKTTAEYPNGIVDNCIKNCLVKEIEAMSEEGDTVIIFAFGENAYNGLKRYFRKTKYTINNRIIKLECLPHPSPRNPIKGNEFTARIYETVTKTLYENKFYEFAEDNSADRIKAFEACLNETPRLKCPTQKQLKKEEVVARLQKFFKNNNITNCEGKAYKEGQINYEICTLYGSNVQYLIFRRKEGDKEVWVRYSFATGGIELSEHKCDSGNKKKWVDGDCNHSDLYKIMAQFKDDIKNYK